MSNFGRTLARGTAMRKSNASAALKKAKRETQDAFKSFVRHWPTRLSKKGANEPPPKSASPKQTRDVNGDTPRAPQPPSPRAPQPPSPRAPQPPSPREPERLAPKAEIEEAKASPSPSHGSLHDQWQKLKDQSTKDKTGVLYLQHSGDTKKMTWDSTVSDMQGLRALFLRAFVAISTDFVVSKNVKVYIQDSAKQDVFFELEKFEDLKDRSVLKLHEVKPPDDESYFSEPELDPSLDRTKRGTMPIPTTSSSVYNYGPRHYGTLGTEYRRPASAMAHAPPKPQRYNSGGQAHRNYASPTSPVAPPFDTLDVYQPRPESRGTNSLSRSGSVTPIIDEEARVRMDYMENQLSSLSTLVHSALMTHGKSANNDAVYRDIESIRKEIFGDDVTSENGSISRYSDALSSMTGSEFTPELRQSLRHARRRAREVQAELRTLRRAAQINAQSTRTILKDAFERIKVVLHSNQHLQLFGQPPDILTRDPLQMERHLADHEQERLRGSTQNLEKDMFALEKEIEEIRHKVVNGQRRLRVTEVEKFTEKLTHIGKSAAVMKGQFPNFQQRLKNVMSAEMEKVVKEERFLKQEPERLDGVLRRCKKLANTMVTMKKLAMVQDPVTPAGPAPIYETAQLSSASHENGVHTTAVSEPKPRSAISLDRDVYSRPLASIGPPPQRKASDTSILDSILEELKSVASSPSRQKYASTSAVDRTPEAPRRPLDLPLANGDDRRIQPIPPPPPPPQGYTPSDDHEVETLLDRIHKAQSSLKSPGQPARPESTPIYSRSAPRFGQSETPSSTGWSGRTYIAPRVPTMPNQLPTIQAGYYHQDTHSPRRSTTPNSITSEPPYMYSPSRKPAPPPPPRSSSRGPSAKYSDDDIQRMKQQLLNTERYLKPTPVHHQNGGIRREHSHTPQPSVRTDATMEDFDYRFLKSASSSESINSQDGSTHGPRLPPPPPTRAMYR